MSGGRRTILFVGAGGAVASKLLPELARHYDLVGIAGQRRDLAPYCTEMLSGDMTSEGPRLFEEACARHSFDVVVWNVVRYYPKPLAEASRGALHLEFDLAIALPLECLRTVRAHGFSGSFVLVTSGLAFGTKPPWGSYSIVKRGQIILAEYLAQELAGEIAPKTIALGAIKEVPAETLAEVFARAVENVDPNTVHYRAYGANWERI